MFGAMQPRKNSSNRMRSLIIDDEENIRRTTAVVLEAMGHETAEQREPGRRAQASETDHFDLAFLDLKLDGESGLDLLPEMLKIDPQLEVVVFTAYASIETAVEAMRRGAVDYIPKPFTPEQIRRVLSRLLEARRLRERVADLESRLSADAPAVELTSAEPAMQKAFDLASKAAATPATILLLGESGTGKTVLARAIHARSPHKDNAFVTVNCPSLSRELLESELVRPRQGRLYRRGGRQGGQGGAGGRRHALPGRDRGTAVEIQPKLLRLLQEKEYERVGGAKTRRANVRVISATNRNLEKAVQEGRFREDLYYRLNVISFMVPPLRERLATCRASRGVTCSSLPDNAASGSRAFRGGEASAARLCVAGQLARIAQCHRTSGHPGQQ